MPTKNTDKITRSLHDPGRDVLRFTLPYHEVLELHGSANGSLSIERLPDGGAEIRTRENIHAWGNNQVIRLDADAWKVVQEFVAGGKGGDYITPYRESWLAEQIHKEGRRES